MLSCLLKANGPYHCIIPSGAVTLSSCSLHFIRARQMSVLVCFGFLNQTDVSSVCFGWVCSSCFDQMLLSFI